MSLHDQEYNIIQIIIFFQLSRLPFTSSPHLTYRQASSLEQLSLSKREREGDGEKKS